MSITDYIGRRGDVVAYGGVRARGETLAIQQLFSPTNPGELCFGAQKVAQQYVLKLFKVRGSMRYRKDEGTEFMLLAMQGRLRTQLDVLMAFAAAQADIKQSFENDEQADDPDDEKFADAEVLAVNVVLATVSMRLQINTQAGANRQILLPLPTTLGAPLT